MVLVPDAVLFSLATTQFNGLLAFYRRLLGDPIQLAENKHATFALPGSRLVVWSSQERVKPGNALELCLQVGNLEAAMAAVADWVVLESVNQASHGRETFFRDPDGNRIILYQPHARDLM